MLLVFDVGNTNISAGIFRGKELLQEFRLSTESGRTSDEYGVLLRALFERALGSDYKFESAIISSVVPPVTEEVERLARQHFGVRALVVGPGTKTGLPIRVDDPRSVGADRIVNAVAVKHEYGTPAVVVDFGTATTVDLVSKDGAYEGGAIAPGILLSLEALVERTAKLPQVELVWPSTVIGKGTVPAMQAGTLVGYVCMVDGLIERVFAEQGKIEYVVSTGGLGALVAPHTKYLRRHDPHLTMTGLRIIHEMNKS